MLNFPVTPHTMLFRFLIAAFALVLLCITPLANALELQLDNRQGEYRLEQYLDILEDPDGKLSLEEIRRQSIADQFVRNTGSVPNRGFSKSAYWLRIRIHLHENALASKWWLEVAWPSLDHVDYYFPDDAGYQLIQTGDEHPFRTRPYPHRHFVFPIKHRKDQSITVYLRVATKNPLVFPLTIWEDSRLVEYTNQISFFFMASYGIMSAMVLYNLFIFFSLRDRSYLLYSFYSSALMLLFIWSNGTGFQFFWPDSPWLQNVASPVLFAIICIAMIAFSRRFLNTRHHIPALDRLLRYLIYPSIVLLAWGLVAPSNFTGQFSSMLSMLVMGLSWFSAFLVWRKGNRQAGFLLLAFTIFLVFAFMTQLRNHEILLPHLAHVYGTQIGVVIETLLLGFALADRINVLRREKDEAQVLTVQSLLESERTLERNVVERTAALSKANQKLSETVEQLSRLNKEKSEFLGIVAHDLNSPLSGVLLSVKGMAAHYDQFEARQIKEKLIDVGGTITHVSGIIARLLRLNHMEEGISMRSDPERVDLTAIIQALVSDFAGLAQRKNIMLKHDCSTAGVITADYFSVYEVIENLISNAIKFSPSGTEISIRLFCLGQRLRIEVKDQGPGLTQEDQAKLFQKYVRLCARPTGNEKSTGLGLAIAKKLTQDLRGKIWCESTHGHGACFIVELPMVASEEVICSDSRPDCMDVDPGRISDLIIKKNND